MQKDKIFKHCPAINVGIFDIGTRSHGPFPNNENVVDIIFGKTLPDELGGGRVFAGVYAGGHAMGPDQKGFMVSFEKSFGKTKDCHGEKRFCLKFAADYASGKNSVGGGGVGLLNDFTPEISILTGSVLMIPGSMDGGNGSSILSDNLGLRSIF